MINEIKEKVNVSNLFVAMIFILTYFFSLVCRNFTETSLQHLSLHMAYQLKQPPFPALPLLLGKVFRYMSSGKIIFPTNTFSLQITLSILPSRPWEACQLSSTCMAVSIPHNAMAVLPHGLLVTIKKLALCGPKQPTSTLTFSLLAISGTSLIIG